MALFDFFKKKKTQEKEPKRYPITPEMTDGVSFVYSLIKDQFFLIEKSGVKTPPLLYKGDNGDYEINQWLAGYISGFYDAFLQSKNQKYDPNALELIFSVLYGEEVAEEGIKQCIVAMMTLGDKSDNLFKVAFEEFDDGLYAGGNNFFDWKDKKIIAPLGIYNKYAM